MISVGSLVDIADMLGVDRPADGTALDDPAWRKLMAVLRAKFNVPRLASCFKIRYSTGVQRRWSGKLAAGPEGCLLRLRD